MASANATAGFDADSFANYLFSDLGFLLALFGDLPTKQFLTLSTGWCDNIALAVAPIGIPTIFVSAIRVAGHKQLKAVIGRSRESRTSAEVEVLSSTSKEVCELWSGNEIVRIVGQPPIKEVIRYIASGRDSTVPTSTPGQDEWMDLDEATKLGRFRVCPTYGASEPDTEQSQSLSRMEKFADCAPNLTFNIEREVTTDSERKFWAGIALVLQIIVFSIWALTTFYWKVGRANKAPPKYGFPCAITGAGFVFLGVLLCGYVVEDVTAELHATPSTNCDAYKVMRIQRSCTIGSQIFSGYLIHNKEGDSTISMSRRVNVKEPTKKHKYLTLVGTLSGCVGFVVQFIGLRTLHWGATVAQIVATIIMIIIRAWLRRALLQEPRCDELLSEHELSHVAFILSRCKGEPGEPRNMQEDKYLGWGLLTTAKLEKSDFDAPEGDNIKNEEEVDNANDPSSVDAENQELISYGMSLVKMRVRIGRTTRWEEACSFWGKALATAIEDVFEKLKSMSVGTNPRVIFNNEIQERAWKLATYVRVNRQVVKKTVLSIDPDTIPLGVAPANRNDRGDLIKRGGEYYSAILCLWHYRIAELRKNVDYSGQFPFARVVGFYDAEKEPKNPIRRWIRTPLWTVPPDHYDWKQDSWPGWKLKAFDTTTSFGRQFTVVPQNDEHRLEQRWRAHPERLAIAVDGGDSIPQNCAFELFSMYIFYITSTIKEINAPPVTDPDGKLKNRVIEELAEVVQISELAKSLEEARTLLIPSFFYRNLLSLP